MVGRFAFGVLVTLLVSVPEAAWAQVYPAHLEYSDTSSWAPESPYSANPALSGDIVPVNYAPYPGEMPGAAGEYAGMQYAGGMADPMSEPVAPAPFPDGAPNGPYPPYSPYIPMAPSDDLHPLEAGYQRFRGTHFCDVFGDAFRESYFRMEYLFWKIDDPGSTLLGSGILNNSHPHDPFNIVAPVVGTAQVEDLTPVNLHDNSGFRGTWGIPLMFGTFEIGGFVLQQAGDSFFSPELPNGNNFFIATSTKLDGQLSNLQRSYDVSFEATYQSDIWGTDVNILFDPRVPGEGWNQRPIIGFKFLNVRENLTQIGVASAVPDWRTTIASDSSNNVYGLNLGLETSFEHKYFTIGVRPQVALGFNSFRNKVYTDNWVSATEGRVQDELTDTQFTPMAEMSIFLRVPMSENFNFYAGFTGMYIHQLQRPDESIVYDTTSDGAGTPVAANFQAQKVDESLSFFGWTVGGEFIFR